jgi:hypothetical protein
MLFMLLVVPYPALFGIALAMPGRRSLLLLALLLGAPLGWLALESFRSLERAPGGVGLGIGVLIGIIGMALAGLLFGVITRVVLLQIPRPRRSRRQSIVIVLVGFFAMPLLLAMSTWSPQRTVRVQDLSSLAAEQHVDVTRVDVGRGRQRAMHNGTTGLQH